MEITPPQRRSQGTDPDMSFGMSITTPIMPSPSFGSLEAAFANPSTGPGRQRSGASNPATPSRSCLMDGISLDPIHLSFDLGVHLDDGLDDLGIADVEMSDLGIADVEMSSEGSNGGDGGGIEGGDSDAQEDRGEIDEDVWRHMYEQLQIYYHIYSHTNVSPTDNDPALERFVDRIRQGRSHLNAERARQLAEINFRYELGEDDADWYNNLQTVHRHISTVGAHRLGEIEDVELLFWLGVQMTGHLGLDHAGVAHDVNQTAALRTLEILGNGLDWQSLSLNRR